MPDFSLNGREEELALKAYCNAASRCLAGPDADHVIFVPRRRDVTGPACTGRPVAEAGR